MLHIGLVHRSATLLLLSSFVPSGQPWRSSVPSTGLMSSPTLCSEVGTGRVTTQKKTERQNVPDSFETPPQRKQVSAWPQVQVLEWLRRNLCCSCWCASCCQMCFNEIGRGGKTKGFSWWANLPYVRGSVESVTSKCKSNKVFIITKPPIIDNGSCPSGFIITNTSH